MKRDCRLWSVAVLFSWMFSAANGQADWRVLPENGTLYGKESSQRLLVQRLDGVDFAGPAAGVIWSSSDPAIATVNAEGVLIPHSDGEVTITATVNGETATARYRVVETGSENSWNFTNHVLPVLSKTGCNMGACHGALAGKGGFRLSLRGYDPPTDFFNIVQQDRGRRVEFGDPGSSLLLSKPSGGVPHRGGIRFETDSLEYRILSEWIATGATGPAATDPELTRLEIFPERTRLRRGDKQPLLVRATYSDGRTEDVTRWVIWTSANEAVCRVSPTGEIEVIGPGEGAVSAWFSSQLVMSRITVPYTNQISSEQYAALPARNFIDELINQQLERLQLPASPPCTDAEFIRRAYLDTIGLLPTSDAVRAFIADATADKRDRLIEQLLARPEFVDYWTYKWSDVLMLNGTLLRPEALQAYYKWIRHHVEQNTPWDQLVREILTATGSSVENGATNFYALYQTPEEMTENACQAFLGLSIGCAKCHNHPLEKWTNDQYYAMANLFSRVKAKGWGGEPRSGDGKRTLYVAETGELVQPRTGKPQPPTPLDGEPIPFDAPGDRREHLARWLTAPENPYFARAITNRVWANFFGIGLVHETDDLRFTNPASNEELLQRAAQLVIDNRFDLKALMRAILQSHAYQRASEPVPGNEADQRFYSRYYPRRLMAEVLHDAVVQVTGVPTRFEFVAFPGADRQKTDFYPLGTRAIQLYDSSVESYFLQTFGRNSRNIVCECERSSEPSMVQVLHISNGNTINEKLQAADGTVTRLMTLHSQGMSLDALIEEAFLQCLARFPTAREREQALQIFTETPAAELRQTVEDLYWGLLSSREFLFNR